MKKCRIFIIFTMFMAFCTSSGFAQTVYVSEEEAPTERVVVLSPGEVVYESYKCVAEIDGLWHLKTTCSWDKSWTGAVNKVLEAGDGQSVKYVPNPALLGIGFMLLSMLAFLISPKIESEDADNIEYADAFHACAIVAIAIATPFIYGTVTVVSTAYIPVILVAMVISGIAMIINRASLKLYWCLRVLSLLLMIVSCFLV